jgi:hypothetical protein
VGVARVEQAYGREVEVSVLAGFWVCAFAFVLALGAAARWGHVPPPKPRYRVQ